MRHSGRVYDPAVTIQPVRSDDIVERAGIVYLCIPDPFYGNPVNGTNGRSPWSHVDAAVDRLVELGVRWIRFPVPPSNGSHSTHPSMSVQPSSLGQVNPACLAFGRYCIEKFMAAGFGIMLIVSDDRSMRVLEDWCNDGLFGSYRRLIFEGINEGPSFLQSAHAPGAGTGQNWGSGQSIAVGQIRYGARNGGEWYCIQAHTSSAGNQPPDSVSSVLMTTTNTHWVPLWAFAQLYYNDAMRALRDGLAATDPTWDEVLIADGGLANRDYYPTPTFVAQSVFGTSSQFSTQTNANDLCADLLNVHNYGYARDVMAAETNVTTGLPATVGAGRTSNQQIIVGEFGGSGANAANSANVAQGWVAASRFGVYQAYKFGFLDDKLFTGDLEGQQMWYGSTWAQDDGHGILQIPLGRAMPGTGDPFVEKTGYAALRNLLNYLADPGGAHVPAPLVVSVDTAGTWGVTEVTGSAEHGATIGQRQNGEYDLVVYMVDSLNPDIQPAQNLTVNLPGSCEAISLYDPLLDTTTTLTVTGGQTAFTFTGKLQSYPVVVRIRL